MIIAIDGPSGAGKSSVAKEVARRLSFSCLDTGAMYRSVAWYAIEHSIALDDEKSLANVALNKQITFTHIPGDPSPAAVFIDGEDVTSAIRTAEVDKAVSPVSAVPSVRRALVVQQQRIGKSGNYVVEGRDIGTAVFPSAEVKVFMTASAEERARRRVEQNLERGVGSTNYDEVLQAIRDRDAYDSSRAASPLKAADDACVLDTTDMVIEEVVQTICDLAYRAGASKPADAAIAAMPE